MEIVFLIIGIAVGALLAFFISKSKFQSVKGVSESDYTSLKNELGMISNEKAKSDERSSMLSASLEENKKVLESEREKIIGLNSQFARISAVNSGLEEKLNDQKKELNELQLKFISEFENLANKILEDKSKRFTEQNKDNINLILEPLKEKIIDFENKVNEVYVKDTKERAALTEQLKNLHELNKMMSEEATNLTRALKGDTQQQGAWGEFILESILEKSGLVRGREFFIQETLNNIDGEKLRPDVIIKLPEEKSIVIDSKVTLVAYEQYSSCDNDDARKKALAEHLNSVKRHIKILSPKDYQNLYGLQSLDFVLMFIPIEPAFALAVQNEPNIFNDAFDRNIVIVSPTTLLATLRTIASIWKQEKQNRNALEIAKKSGELYDKLSAFVEDLLKVGGKMDDAKKSYEEAMKKLADGKGNIISRIETIRIMGAKATKLIDARIVSRAINDEEEDEIKDKEEDKVEQLKLIDPESEIG